MDDKNEKVALYKKLAAIRSKVGKIEKDGSNTYQKYTYQSAEAVFTAVRSAMTEEGVLMLVQHDDVSVVLESWLVVFTFTLVDVDTGATLSFTWQQAAPVYASSSKGDYIDDKALGKINTYAQRVFLQKLFLISSKDDVDLDQDDTTTKPRRTSSSNITPMPSNDEQVLVTDADEIDIAESSNGNTYYYVIANGVKVTTFSREVFRQAGFDELNTIDSEATKAKLYDGTARIHYRLKTVNDRTFGEMVRVEKVQAKQAS